MIVTVARFSLNGAVLPRITDTVRVGEAFRAAAMSRFDSWCRTHRPAQVQRVRRSDQPDRCASPVLSGKDASGQLLAGHRHAYYLATDEDRDGHLDHLTVYAADGLGKDEVAALQRLQKLTGGVEEPLRLLLVGLGQPQDFTAPLLRSSACWVSETPFLVTRHVKRRGRRKDPPEVWHAGRSPDFARLVLEEELARLRLRRPEVPPPESITLREGNRMSALQLSPLPFRRFRGKVEDDGGQRAAGAFRVLFPSPVTGPICLGHSGHFGLGLFLPEPAPDDL
jgi:CRISPR-associated protein Csb2